MPDGCNLYFTEKDLKEVKASLNRGITWNYTGEAKTATKILKVGLTKNLDEFKKILSSHFDSRKPIVEKLLEKSFSQGQLNAEDETSLSKALLFLLEREQKVTQLFQEPKNLNELFENLIEDEYPKDKETSSLKRGGALITVASILQKKEVLTSLGNKLEIKDNDIIGFGQKLPSRYSLNSKSDSLLEADTLISRVKEDPLPPIPAVFDIIGLDTKYLKEEINHKKYDYTTGLDIQLAGIEKSFKNPAFKEFYFITNAQFGERFINKIHDFNYGIIKEKILIDEKFKKEFGEFVIPGEGLLGIDRINTSIFKPENNKKYSQMISKYDVPQVGICENINYEK